MKIVFNSLVPIRGYIALNFFGLVFVRREWKGSSHLEVTCNHESIHSAQMMDFFIGPKFLRIFIGGIVFYIIYLVEFISRIGRGWKESYRAISFEREAFIHERDGEYLKERRRFAQWRKA